MKASMIVLSILCGAALLLLQKPAFAQVKSIPKINSIVEFRGTWEEIGKQQAYYFPEMTIQVSLIIQLLLGISSDDVRAYYEDIKDLIPESIQQQMQGIALGLTEYWFMPPDKAWDAVLMLELGGDVAYKMQEGVWGCTAFAFHSKDGTFMAHNSDQPPTSLDLYAVSHFVPTNGDNSFISVGVPAGAVSVGMVINEQNIGLTFNLGEPNKNAQSGVPVMHMCREVITKSDTLDEAVGYFTDILDAKGTFSYMAGNILIADLANGTMARIQVCSDDVKVTYGQQLKEGVTYLAFTNHFDDDFSPLTQEDLESASNASSIERYKRLNELIPQFETYDLDTCWDILSDYGDTEPGYNTICRNSRQFITSYANVFTAEKTYYTIGPACEYLPLYAMPQVIDNKEPVVPSIIGTVTTSGQPLAKARVVIEGITVKGINLTTRTAGDGSYVFNNLESGIYRIRINRFLHLPRSTTVECIEGQVATADLNLLF
jgi:predicted choloylglycine hydrolase